MSASLPSFQLPIRVARANFCAVLWRFKDRLKSWQELGSRLFDGHLDTFKDTVLEVLQVDDPSSAV
jgi:hypothetical protein